MSFWEVVNVGDPSYNVSEIVTVVQYSIHDHHYQFSLELEVIKVDVFN